MKWLKIVLGVGGVLFVGVVVLALVGGGGVPGTCAELVPEIVKMSEERAGPMRPAIVKLYDVRAVVPASAPDRVLDCAGEALLSSNVRRPVSFAVVRDQDGQQFFVFGPPGQ